MRRRRRVPEQPPVTWLDRSADAPVVNVCHPDWRGVRAATATFRAPTVVAGDLAGTAASIIEDLSGMGTRTLVVQGFPPGAPVLLQLARQEDLQTAVVLHSSLTQLGAEPGEREMTDTVLELLSSGAIGRLGFVKEGLAEAYRALGFEAWYVPNRVPVLPEVLPGTLDGFNVGVFAGQFWRKNVPNQLAAVALLGGTPHTMASPEGEVFAALDVVAHGELPWLEFLSLQASMDLNLYVTLSECHPLTPIESYLLGVPCLLSRTSAVFRSDPELWELTTVAELDNPRIIAAAGRRLLEEAGEAIDRAGAWMETFDLIAADLWAEFTGG